MREEWPTKNGRLREPAVRVAPLGSTPPRKAGEIARRKTTNDRPEMACRSSCPSWDRTRTLLIQSQACCQLHQGAMIFSFRRTGILVKYFSLRDHSTPFPRHDTDHDLRFRHSNSARRRGLAPRCTAPYR